MGQVITPFNVGVDTNKKMSTPQFIQMLAMEAQASMKEDFAVADNRAKHFCRDLFTGKKKVLCRCGKVIRFKNGSLRCPECGTDNDRVEYTEDYQDRAIKTIIDVKKQAYALSEEGI